jgi:hypothetical protein
MQTATLIACRTMKGAAARKIVAIERWGGARLFRSNSE